MSKTLRDPLAGRRSPLAGRQSLILFSTIRARYRKSPANRLLPLPVSQLY